MMLKTFNIEAQNLQEAELAVEAKYNDWASRIPAVGHGQICLLNIMKIMFLNGESSSRYIFEARVATKVEQSLWTTLKTFFKIAFYGPERWT